MKSFKTIDTENVFELTEKRSRFIATLRHVETEEEATEFINEMRSKYWDARHNVYAYALESGNIKRFSDDGEPHGTAGKPMLDVIEGAELLNVAVVVTRYFGGVLLGTGGLVRAYSSATQGAVSSATIKTMTECTDMQIICEYNIFTMLSNIINDFSGNIISTDFSNEVLVNFYIPEDKKEHFCKKITDAFNGKITAKLLNNNFYLI